MRFPYKIFIKISLLNLLIIAALGTLMRYKIGFEFPYFEQKNLQLAHSHFAFTGWASHSLFCLIIYYFKDSLNEIKIQKYKYLIILNLCFAYGILLSFLFYGYSLLSFSLSFGAIFVSYLFTYLFYKDFKAQLKSNPAVKWILAAMVYNVISSLGLINIAYLILNHHLSSHAFLGSQYFYLHFQYNGWFLLGCIGIFVGLLHNAGLELNDKTIFRLIAYTCLPTFLLSILWLHLPNWLYAICVIATILQLVGLLKLWQKIILLRLEIAKIFNRLIISLLILSGIALSAKMLLQFGSIFPTISKLAYGFRPIVVAYLHLILLGAISTFILSSLIKYKKMPLLKSGLVGLLVLIVGIYLTEIILLIQGVASFAYFAVPMINESLFVVAFFMFVGILLLLFSWKDGREN